MLKSQFQKNLIEAGCDEVGRGCIAGPVVAASVSIHEKFLPYKINDSKKIEMKLINGDSLKNYYKKDLKIYMLWVKWQVKT